MENKIEFGKKDIVSTIIVENYERFLDVKKSLVPTKYVDNIRETVEKMKPCKDTKFGFAQYICPNCYESHKIGFTCKCKFCNSCGKVYADKWIQKQKELMLDTPHRHMVFTIPDRFRMAIYNNINLIKPLSDAISSIILSSLNSSFKTTKNQRKLKKTTKGIVKPAIISVLHTFGRDLKFLTFAERFKKFFGINFLICPKCSEEMILLNIWHHKYGIIFSLSAPS